MLTGRICDRDRGRIRDVVRGRDGGRDRNRDRKSIVLFSRIWS